MNPTFDYNGTLVTINHAVIDYDWGQSQDIEHESVITYNRKFISIGDHAEVTITCYLWKNSADVQNAIKDCRGKEGTLTTDIGSGQFRCTQIKYYLLKRRTNRKYCIMTFRSMQHV